MRAWTSDASDLNGCVLLREPRLVAPRSTDLLAADTPVLALVDKLEALGVRWRGIRSQTHAEIAIAVRQPVTGLSRPILAGGFHVGRVVPTRCD